MIVFYFGEIWKQINYFNHVIYQKLLKCIQKIEREARAP